MMVSMTIAQEFSGSVVFGGHWAANWGWGVPLIVLTLVFHVFGLLLIRERVDGVRHEAAERYGSTVMFTVIIGMAALVATLLHATEGIIWAVAYRLVGALPTNESAVLYSLSAITSYGHTNLILEQRWQLMGALEALNGMLLFGLTTAFLFGVIQKASELRNGGANR
jgi:hypothetical protein